MGLMQWIGRPFGLLSGPWRAYYGTESTSGETVTYDKAMQLDAVWACVNLIANSIKTLPCLVYKDDGVTVDRESQLYELLHDMPNFDDTAADFWAMVAMCLCLDGNFFAEKKMRGSSLSSLIPFDPLCVEVCRDDRNARYYEVTERVNGRGKGGKRKISAENMLHIRGALLPGCDRGLSPISVERNVIGNALSGEKASGRMFKNGLLGTTLLSSDQILKPEQRKQISDTLTQFAGAEKAGGVTILEAGLTPHSLNINPKDAQMLESRQYSVEQICRIFGVPPVMIGHAANGTTTWGSGIEQLILQFTKTCLVPMLRSIESAIYRDLLTPQTRKTTVVKFSIEGLLRGDSAARADFLSKMVTNGIYTPNEARSYENKAPVDGGETAIVNGTMTPLNKLGETMENPPNSQEQPLKRAA
ncbi:phage portal protein [Sinorhizobium meliloti]|uniref:phage portal protein n=1 Tax=Rhizobium meliloti TaxID=382 RepID=UPI000B5A3496|nr:phage portal protein [Sinorhizobium meliloti]ASJ59386.1 phage portal protein [Sinorhizobium meliloti]MCK3783071.1 phage portal protein [Sinorhizobium meliloti]MCK3788299.1 phage portal protein [Sinorhizobium meliloti]MCK3794424.1 phage portal protein [Sinorhizobium meliloti]